MEFQSFEEMIEFDVNINDGIGEEVHQILQTVYFTTGADQRSVSSSELSKSLGMILGVHFIRSRSRTLSRYGCD
ncbi:hypothetical protein F2Q68_00015254 [Brassica cretica]|uniref:Uncharacterized protein n=2 Tax=Brassica cretica TaxID=69181 RepID=A0A8S9HKI9_BRACR|nr:hypothetical protein F2Q68_00015254 [Brassica cretica]KAF3605988.1 hypothetical protein DY000_02047946 [Brassica cretica]